jgi:hypothetical protein
VQIIGSGAGSTTLTGPALDSKTVLTMNNPASVVSDLSIYVPNDTAPDTKLGLIVSSGTARRISVSADPSSTPVVIGVQLTSGILEDSTIALGSNVPAVTTALQLDGQATARDDTLTAKNGVNVLGPDSHLERDRITAAGNGISIRNSDSNIDAADTLIQLVGNGTGAVADDGNNTPAGISLLGVTIAGDGSPNSTGVMSLSNNGHATSVHVNSSIIRGVGHSVTLGQKLGAASAELSFTDYDPARIKQIFAATPGTVTDGPGNINADPLFAGPTDFRPSPGSPVIDAGDPAASSDASDLAGNDRVLDGSGSGVARRDMGALEAPAAPVVTKPGDGGSPPGGSQAAVVPAADLTISGLTVSPSRFAVGAGSKSRHSRMARGTRFRFSLSAAADVRLVIQRGLHGRFHKVGTLARRAAAGADSIRFSGRLAGRALRPGRYRALVSAVDGAGHRTVAQRVSFTIVRG